MGLPRLHGSRSEVARRIKKGEVNYEFKIKELEAGDAQCGVRNRGEGVTKPLESLYAFISEAEGEECLTLYCSEKWVFHVLAESLEEAQLLMPHARECAMELGQTLKLVRYQRAEIIGEVTPGRKQ